MKLCPGQKGKQPVEGKLISPASLSLSSRVGFSRVGSWTSGGGSSRHSRSSQSHFTGTWPFLAVTGRAAQLASAAPSQSIKYASDQDSSRNRKHLGGNLLEIMATCACLLPEVVAGLNSHKGSNHTVNFREWLSTV